MRFKFDDLILEIDVDKTRRFYESLPKITDDCSCDGCRNYMLAIEDFPQEVKSFFRKLGIEPEKASEVFTWSSACESNTAHYGGFYHFCGELIKGKDCWRKIDKSEAIMGELHAITSGYFVGFTNRISLAEENLCEPALQMEIDFHRVPWKLDKKNTC